MRILFITPSYKPAYVYGGPIVVIALLAETLARLGHDVSVYTTTANGLTELPVATDVMTLVEGVKVYYFKRITKDHTHVSFALWRCLRNTANQFDTIHIHSWWNFLVLGAAFICKQKKIKPILSPHGMFSRYILNTNNAGSKRWVHRLAGKSLLKNTRLHVSTQMEWNESQTIVPDWEGAIIPNLVALPSERIQRMQNDVFTIGFLSRIDPKKGLDILMQALRRVNFTYRLLVAGDGEPQYIKHLQEMAERIGIAGNIEWVGWKSNDEKFTFLSRLDLLSLTSHSENFAIVIIESLSVGTPVLISDGVGLASYVEQYQFGWVTNTDVAAIASQLTAAYYDEHSRQRIQSTSPQTIEQHFDRMQLARQYVELYTTNALTHERTITV